MNGKAEAMAKAAANANANTNANAKGAQEQMYLIPTARLSLESPRAGWSRSTSTGAVSVAPRPSNLDPRPYLAPRTHTARPRLRGGAKVHRETADGEADDGKGRRTEATNGTLCCAHAYTM